MNTVRNCHDPVNGAYLAWLTAKFLGVDFIVSGEWMTYRSGSFFVETWKHSRIVAIRTATDADHEAAMDGRMRQYTAPGVRDSVDAWAIRNGG